MQRNVSHGPHKASRHCVISRTLNLILAIAQWEASEAASYVSSQGAPFHRANVQFSENTSLGARGLGSNISHCKYCYRPVQNRRGVIPTLSKVNATIIIGLPSSSFGAYLCIFPAVVLKLFWVVVVVVFTDRFERLTWQIWTVFPQKETRTKYFADDFKVFTDARISSLGFQLQKSSLYLICSKSCLYFYLWNIQWVKRNWYLQIHLLHLARCVIFHWK